MPLISVIIPVYNGEKYLGKCIESVLNQTLREFEVIIIDDGSVDRSFEIAKAFSETDSRVRLIHTDNKGVCHARNTGINMACGTYVTFVDADDRLVPEALRLMYTLITEKEAEISIMSKIYLSVDEEIYCEQVYEKEVQIWEGNDIIKKSIDDHPASHSAYAKLYKSDLLRGIRFQEGRKIHEDSFFVFECFSKCRRAVYWNTGVYLYYVTPDSASRADFSDKFFDILYFSEKKCEIIERDYTEFEKCTVAIIMRANLALLYNLCKTYDMHYRESQKKCLNTIKGLRKQFVPVYKFEKRFLRVIKYKLFWLYKLYLYFRMNR